MNIRKALPEDSKVIAPLMLLAMEEIVYQLIGKKSLKDATQFLEQLIRKENTQYSYQNCWLVEIENEVVAMANVYNGSKLNELRLPVQSLIKSMFNRDFSPEDETKEDEFYIDCIGVRTDQQGKGIGAKLIDYLIQEYTDLPLGLLVDKENPKAKKLYINLGFEVVGEIVLAGREMQNLQTRRNTHRK